ncbi:MAG: transcriptional repressor [Nitrospirae bacterium]|nr:transcriptional repressor [Nitrospirota bacterium]
MEKKIKMTPQRAAIMEYLDGNMSHPSADEIYTEVHKMYPMMSFATVYNTLDALKKQNMVWELSVDGDRRRYDPRTEPHDHLVCVDCRSIKDIGHNGHKCPSGDELKGYMILREHVEYFGLCPKCQRKRGMGGDG